MLSKRVIAVTGDRAVGKKLAAGLMAAGGQVETVWSPRELHRGGESAELAVVHVTDEASRAWLREIEPHLAKQARIIAVIPRSSLEDAVAAMQVGRVAAVVVAEELASSDVSAIASRLLFGDVFGLEKLVPWGVRVYSQLVGDYQEKSVAIAAVSEFAAAMGVRRKYREAIEQCLDEMLMNALYDAPVDEDGVHLFADVPTKSRISLRMEQKAVVQYACDGRRFAVSVRDAFGTLGPATVLRYLDKCLHAPQQIDRKAGGAGLGLYLISNASTQFFISIHAGVATEAMCTFDLTAPRMRLQQLGVFEEKIDAVGRLAGGRPRLVAPGGGRASLPRALTAALLTAIALLIALIGIVTYPRLFGGARGAIEISTTPPGATVKVDGRVVGTTAGAPVVVDDLRAGESYVVSARLAGYQPAQSIISPRKGRTLPLALSLAPRAAKVVFNSDPPGAKVVVRGVTRGRTPLTLTDLPADKQVAVAFHKTGYVEVKQQVSVPSPGRQASVMASLRLSPEFASVSIVTHPPGAELYENGQLVPGKVTPVDGLLVQAGKPYLLALERSGYVAQRRRVKLAAGQRKALDVVLRRGGSLTVSVNVPHARVSVAGVARCRNVPAPLTSCPLKNGRYSVRLYSHTPYLSERFHVSVRNDNVRRAVVVGFVETASAELRLKIRGAPSDTHRAAFAAGTRTVTLVNAKGKTEQKRVRVVARHTVKVGWGP